MAQVSNFLGKLWQALTGGRKKGTQATSVYFISGMCYNCTVFDSLILPKGFEKKYIEWYIPQGDETLEQYARAIAKDIDTNSPFVLVGYSFGGVIVQEMNRFLSPQKNILISSFKAVDEKPMLFRAVKRAHLTGMIPDRMYLSTEFITDVFNRLVYNLPTEELAQYMTVTDPRYVKWAVRQITEWIPEANSSNLYHIHGTADQIFPYELIRNAFPVEDGDHLMVARKAQVVSSILNSILLMR
ncbi:alpha/beta fold hydrolase [Dysgonomonas sp. 511]|uniref:alpha/beta fold hydrolase n=1 Tax=Dysgonomonas sp. 511 TaxID=2302930 RepID=UPI0013D240A6|nr:alpha/beta hydrolase [Dysgonomonas sp. 511]NDV79757.1 alpha/beta hydrolase [Dysgonomonas sp. 511]